MTNDFLRATRAKSKIAAGLTAIAPLGIGTSATAATFNFQAIADGATFTSTTDSQTGDEGNWNPADSIGPIVGNGAGIVDAGITVRAVGLNSDQQTRRCLL